MSGFWSHTSILTPYLKSTGLFTLGVNFSSNSVQALQRYYNIQGTGALECRYGKPKFRESLCLDDIAKSHLQHGTLVII